jgi:guanidinopropionase
MPRSFLPVSGLESPRFAGPATFMRLPLVDPRGPEARDVRVGLVGVPFDGGTTNRPGARHGPRQLRDLSTMIRRVHPTSGLDPFAAVNCADLGDVPVNPADLADTLKRITEFYEHIAAQGITPLSAGGDHLISLPILRALAREGPLGMIHFDSHTDLFNDYFGGFRLTHGTPFRRAVEEKLLDPRRVVQIGIRGTQYDGEDIAFAKKSGVRVVRIEELFERGVAAVMKEACSIVGAAPIYVSFDIDGIDPSQAPGTGTPEIGGFSTFQAQQMVRRLAGLRIVGADLVEVSPPFDPTGGTAFVGASMMFEILCAMVPGLVT